MAPVVNDEMPMRLEGVVHTEGVNAALLPGEDAQCALQMQYTYNQREAQKPPTHRSKEAGRSFEEVQAKLELSLVIGVITQKEEK